MTYSTNRKHLNTPTVNFLNPKFNLVTANQI